jgi:O-antigen ligase
MTGWLPPPPWMGLIGSAMVVAVGMPSARPLMMVLGGVLVGWYRLQVAVLLWAATLGTMMLAVYRVGNAAVYAGPLLLSLLLFLLGRRWLRAGAREMTGSALTMPLLCLAAVAVVSAVQGAVFYDSTVPGVHRSLLVQIYAAGLVLLSAGTALLVASEIDTEVALRWMFRIVVGVAVFALSATVVPLIRVPQWSPLVLSLGLSLLYARLLCDPPATFWGRALAAGCIVYALMEIVLLPFYVPGEAQWISGWVMLCTSLAVATLLAAPRVFVLILIPVALVAMALSLPLFHKAVELAHAEGDFERFQIWRDAFRIMTVRPLLGVGPGNYLDYAIRYAEGGILFGSAHGNYLQIAAEMGVLGLLAVAWLLVRVAALARRMLNALAEPFYRAVVIGVVAGLSGQLGASVFGDYLLPAYHNGGHTNVCSTLYTWILLGMLMAVERLTSSERR